MVAAAFVAAVAGRLAVWDTVALQVEAIVLTEPLRASALAPIAGGGLVGQGERLNPPVLNLDY